MIETPIVHVKKHFDQTRNMWVISVDGITSGAVLHAHDADSMSLEFKYDAGRYEPLIVVEGV